MQGDINFLASNNKDCTVKDINGNKNVTFRVYYKQTLTNPSWADVEPDISPLQVDTAATYTPNGEQKVFSVKLAKVDSKIVYLKDIDAEIQPEQIYAITAQCATGGTSVVDVSLDFKSRV